MRRPKPTTETCREVRNWSGVRATTAEKQKLKGKFPENSAIAVARTPRTERVVLKRKDRAMKRDKSLKY